MALALVAQHELVCEGCPRRLLEQPVTLAALWLAASESQPPGWRDRAVLRGQRVLVQPLLRLRRHTDRRQCPDGTNWVETARQCCPQCPAGTFLREACVCDPCPAGTFRTRPNTLSECEACYECDQHGSGLEYILLGLTGPLFLGALAIYHKRKRLWHGGGPHPMAQATTSMPGAAATPWYQFNAWRWHNPCWTHPYSPQETGRGTGAAKKSFQREALLREPPSEEGKPSSSPEPRGALLQGSQLYAVIDVVPVRRWKEFMRMLELREAEIELVELEVVHIRDQQYEMLKRWCQQTSATLDQVFAALERMELAGCAEALRQSLPVGP
ncbi:hypothetical protein EK904_011630 [Melospiza melodia maxima]|nr:hypothetical protein EK904_011630 [Melospiza melodia maxima]